MDLHALTPLFQLGAVIVSFVLGLAWLKSSLVKQRHEELEDLAATRGERNKDLEADVEALRTEVAELRGQFQAMQALKADEIAERVAALLKE